jgi:O-antigen/teichoic acid export membrane protein
MRGRTALGKKVLGFVLLPFASSLAPFILLPLLARRVSSEEWAGLGIGQSVGMVGAIAVTWGWQFVGPVLVAGASPEVRKGHYLDSLWVRGVVSLVLTPLLALLSGLVAPSGGKLLAVTMACAIGLSGLTPTWYFIGLGRPAGIAVWDVAPRVLATVAAAALVVGGVSPVCYPLALIAAGLLAVAVFSAVELRDFPVRAHDTSSRRLWSELRRGFTPTSTELTLSLYSSGSVAFVGWRATTETVAVYSSAFRLYRLANYFVTALANGLQSWVAEQEGRVRGRRMLRALQAHTVVGLVGMVGMAAVLPEVSTLLFGARLSVDHVASLYLGVAFLAASVGGSMGRHVLVPAGETKGVFVYTLAGAVVGIPLSVLLAAEWGSSGATAALAVSQSLTVLLAVRRCYRIVRDLLRTEEQSVSAVASEERVGAAGDGFDY